MKLWLVPILFCVATAACAQDLKKFEFEPPVQQARDAKQAGPCGFDNLSVPAGMRVYAAGGYSGRELQFQIDQSGHEATQFDIAANSPGQPVALLLGAYEPTVWNIGWTRGTRIVAVFVSGYHRQAVAGLEKSIPVLNSSYDNKGPCGYVYVSNGQNTALNPLSRRLFNQQVDMVFPGDRKGKIVIGDPLSAEPICSRRARRRRNRFATAMLRWPVRPASTAPLRKAFFVSPLQRMGMPG